MEFFLVSTQRSKKFNIEIQPMVIDCAASPGSAAAESPSGSH